jgi:hypothetical protein
VAGSDPLNVSDKPGLIVKMHPAGEVEFVSELGKTYQIQTVSELNATWQAVGNNITGTGGSISHLVSTRNGGARAFYRVVQITP